MNSSNAWVCGIGLFACALLGAVPSRADAPAASAQDPSQVVKSVAQSFLKDLDAHRAEYSKNPSLLRQAVDRDVVPYFDVQYAARLVLGRFARTATPQQLQEFIKAFENSMFANYGNALLGFQSNRLQVLPTRGTPNPKGTLVRTVIRRDDGSTVSVNFQLHETPEGWKAWDVIVEGISYVKSFRDDFGAQIEQQGLDAVIQRLQRGEKPANLPNTGAKAS
ncbi:MAG TPA: ABC transporter substrate-binding protein [Steroidobacteraceae bacterium]|nr:ABC transporter substrate-binding protein [Steroidobacteraceae bacterium]